MNFNAGDFANTVNLTLSGTPVTQIVVHGGAGSGLQTSGLNLTQSLQIRPNTTAALSGSVTTTGAQDYGTRSP